MDADVVFRRATVVDGRGPARVADVAVAAGRVTAVARDLTVESCPDEIEADGLLLCPGFVDMHAHSALQPFTDPWLRPKIAQGFTTELICPDGLGPAPVSPGRRGDRRNYLRALEGAGPAEWSWTTLGEYLAQLRATGVASTLVAAAPHSAIRDVVMGPAAHPADGSELRGLRSATEETLADGARALSFGLIYAPGMYADERELLVLAECAAAAGVPLVPHVRNEARGVLDSIMEFVRVCEASGASLHLSHVKLIGCPDLVEPLLSLLTSAAERIDLTFDQYPYGAGNTLLSALLPPWAHDGGPQALLGRLADPHENAHIVHDMSAGLPGWENLLGACGPDGITITHAGPPRDDDIGKTLELISDERGENPAQSVVNLLRDTALDAAMIDHYASEDVVRAIFEHPAAMVGSDAIFNAHPHPRLYGTAARVLGRYAIRDHLISIEEAVARLATRPAARLGLTDRGSVDVAQRADLVLLDPKEYVDTATYADPCQEPPGVRRVLINGRTVYSNHANHSTGSDYAPRRLTVSTESLF